MRRSVSLVGVFLLNACASAPQEPGTGLMGGIIPPGAGVIVAPRVGLAAVRTAAARYQMTLLDSGNPGELVGDHLFTASGDAEVRITVRQTSEGVRATAEWSTTDAEGEASRDPTTILGLSPSRNWRRVTWGGAGHADAAFQSVEKLLQTAGAAVLSYEMPD